MSLIETQLLQLGNRVILHARKSAELCPLISGL